MRVVGAILLGLGIIIGLAAFNKDVSVDTPYGRVNNMGLMDDRRNYLMAAGVCAIVGAIFIAMDRKKED